MYSQDDYQRLTHLLDSLHLISGIKFALMNENGREIYSSSFRSPLCALMLEDPIGFKKCVSCDQRAVSKAHNTRCAEKYLCHAGLYEFIMPVVEQDKTIATILCGQLLDDAPQDEQWRRVSARLKWYPDQITLYQRFLQLKRVSPQQMKACMDVVQACVSEVHLRALSAINQRDDAAVLLNYIDTNFTQGIRIDTLCQLLSLGRTKLYSLCAKRFNKTPIQLINDRRMRLARELLRTTNEPIAIIAQSVGIPDTSYFIKLFSKYENQTPMQYRKGARNDV